MCVALPGIVKKINEDHTADVDFSGNIVRAATGLVSVNPGDSVLVHAGCIMQVIDQESADDLNELFDELNRFAGF